MKNKTPDENEWALQVMNNWRACHNYPVNTFQANLRKKIRDRGFRKSLVVQRLKRVPSIIGKLKRFPAMQLSRMQDIGGLRAIVNTTNQVYVLINDFKASRFQHELLREYDYIKEPKQSGYRCVHLVYKYLNSRAPEYNNLQIEIQFRTKLQHAWATAVETMGTFLQHSLKSSEGPEEWLDFFSMAGSAFAFFEDSPLVYEFKDWTANQITKELIRRESKLRLIDQLKAFRQTIKTFEERRYNFKYYLLLLKMKERLVKFEGFKTGELDLATDRYLHYENEFGEQTDNQIVLVSGDSFKSLRRAYPNYFLDTHEFINQLQRLFKKYG
ncbi:RelA/SpoT domain-containing protein [bacterium]|nr:RelA/SpoT domain-containing protein [bacterium]